MSVWLPLPLVYIPLVMLHRLHNYSRSYYRMRMGTQHSKSFLAMVHWLSVRKCDESAISIYKTVMTIWPSNVPVCWPGRHCVQRKLKKMKNIKLSSPLFHPSIHVGTRLESVLSSASRWQITFLLCFQDSKYWHHSYGRSSSHAIAPPGLE